jgi:hypothetical protein
MLFREFVQGRNKTDGSAGGNGGRGGPQGGGYQGRYYTEESLKPELAMTTEPEEGEIVLDEDESDRKTSRPAASTSSDVDDYFMHSIHPSITHPPTASLLASLPRSELQVIDKDEDELAVAEPEDPAAARLRIRLKGATSSATNTPAKAQERGVIHIDVDEEEEKGQRQ